MFHYVDRKMLGAQSLFLLGYNWYDWLVALALLYGVWSGTRNGLSGEILWTVGTISMVLVAVNFYELFGDLLRRVASISTEVANLLAFVILALVIYIITLSVRQTLHKHMKNRSLLSATVENLGGSVGGVLRMAAIMAFFSIALCLTRSKFWHQQVGKESKFGSYVAHQFPPVAAMVQKSFPEQLWFLDKIKRRPEADDSPE